ncbi:MAG: hypothetical protein JWQ18_1122 [Conexibacter sp.]|nr:hypothetical protein [Conexibacter sp.]
MSGGARVSEAVAAGFGLLARARGDRALHPRGVTWAATTTFARPVPGVAALSAPRELDSLLRLSRAIGLPPVLPDILGLALRLHDFDGPGRPLDLLLASSPPPPSHRTLAPARSFERTWFTGLLRYRIGRSRPVLVARSVGPGRFALGAAHPGRREVVALAEVHVTRRLDPPPPEAASFDPILHAAPDFRQAAGRLDALRAAAYRASRNGRAG